MDPNDVHWDEIVVPIIENPSNFGSKEVVLKAWRDLEWIEENRWNRQLWDEEGSRNHVRDLRETILKRHIEKITDDFILENDLSLFREDAKEVVLAVMGDTDNVFIRPFIRASAESESFGHFFNEILESFFDESL